MPNASSSCRRACHGYICRNLFFAYFDEPLQRKFLFITEISPERRLIGAAFGKGKPPTDDQIRRDRLAISKPNTDEACFLRRECHSGCSSEASAEGFIYVTDFHNARVQKFQPK